MEFWFTFLLFLVVSPVLVWCMVGGARYIYYPEKGLRIKAQKSKNLFTKIYVGYWYQTHIILIPLMSFFSAKVFSERYFFSSEPRTEHIALMSILFLLYCPFAVASLFQNESS